jgi:hypothetical protein
VLAGTRVNYYLEDGRVDIEAVCDPAGVTSDLETSQRASNAQGEEIERSPGALFFRDRQQIFILSVQQLARSSE